MLARKVWLRHHQRHHVLKLIAKAIRAAGLVKCRSGPHAAGESLIEQPAVEHEVDGTVGCFHLNRAEDVVPKTLCRGEDRVEAGDVLARRFTGELHDLGRVAELAHGRRRARDVDDVAATDRDRRRTADVGPPDASNQEPAVIGQSESATHVQGHS